jgi:saccharopine dehydrogenase-like NADP-dependent oxidoreductase
MKVLVLGGYGNFGTRICRALAGDSRIELQVAGRDKRKAEMLANEIGAEAAEVDASSAKLAQALHQGGIDLVIHTAGPFQAQDYRVAQAAAEAGAHYIDLADGRRFVCDFGAQVNDAFVAAGRCAVSGASTVPALSSAVVDAALGKFARLDSIDICIAPAQKAPRGRATLEGVLSYCGEPIQVWSGGRWQMLHGWADAARVKFARLKTRSGALCDIPDLELFPSRYPGVKDVMFRAALEVGITQQVFAALASLRRSGLIGSPRALAGLLHRFGGAFDALGTPDGGMVVRLAGIGIGVAAAPLQLAWHITAGSFHGPEIPCMAAILLARKLACGQGPPPGAHTAAGLLALEEFAPEFMRWGMTTHWEEERDSHGA